MITSIFSKSKPINFLIVFVLTFLAFIIVKYQYVQLPVTTLFMAEQVVTYLIFYFSILLLNFIASKNDLTLKNNFEILLYSLFLLLIPESLLSSKVIWSNFFILLALRRLISLRSKKNVKTKLFDASLLIGLASLFYFWSLLFFGLIPIVLLFYSNNNIKHWIIPFLGLATVLVLTISVSIVLYNDYWSLLNSNYYVGFNFSTYNTFQFLVGLTLLFSFGAWATFYYLSSFKKKMRNIRPTFKTIFVVLIIALIIIVIAPKKNGSEFLFLFAPLAIIITNYIEIIKEKWFKELFFGVLLFTPFILLLLQFFTES